MVSPSLLIVQYITGLPRGKCMMMGMYSKICHRSAKISLKTYRPKVFLNLKGPFILS